MVLCDGAELDTGPDDRPPSRVDEPDVDAPEDTALIEPGRSPEEQDEGIAAGTRPCEGRLSKPFVAR
eukprot:2988502-Pyramimonas_sp.AAC.1